MVKLYCYGTDFVEPKEVKMKQSHFPDGTQYLYMDDGILSGNDFMYVILWRYSSDNELFTVTALREQIGNKAPVDLVLPYIPNARMDRVKTENDVFTLKAFTNFINYLQFAEVYVFDPHSNVSTALIDNVKVINPSFHIFNVTHDIAYRETKSCGHNEYMKSLENLLLFYPDEGAMKRYSEMFKHDYAFGVKKRNWSDGAILGLDIIGAEKVKGKNVLIIDDICSAGGTFLHSARKLRELGANHIYLYVSHAEETMYSGEMFNTPGLIDHIYTTNSLGCHSSKPGSTDKVTYLDWKDGNVYESATVD